MQTTEPYESTDATTTLKELFWKRGYERTSIEDVVQATGMKKTVIPEMRVEGAASSESDWNSISLGTMLIALPEHPRAAP